MYILLVLNCAQVGLSFQIDFKCEWNVSSVSTYWSTVPANGANGCWPRQCPVLPAIPYASPNVFTGTIGFDYNSSVSYTCSPNFAFIALGTLQQTVQCAFSENASVAEQMYWNVSETACSGELLNLLIRILCLLTYLEGGVWQNPIK